MDTALTAPDQGSPATPSDRNPAAARLELRIPAHHPAPGEEPDFSNIPRFPADTVARPEVTAVAQETHPLADKLIRVLDDNGAAVGAWDPKLSPETLRRGLRTMMLTRAYDDRMYRQQRQGKISFYMKCTGEEAIGVAQGMALA